MDVEQQRIKALNVCIDIANDYTQEEVKKFTPPSVQRAWEIGNEYLNQMLKEQKKQRKKFTI